MSKMVKVSEKREASPIVMVGGFGGCDLNMVLVEVVGGLVSICEERMVPWKCEVAESGCSRCRADFRVRVANNDLPPVLPHSPYCPLGAFNVLS